MRIPLHNLQETHSKRKYTYTLYNKSHCHPAELARVRWTRVHRHTNLTRRKRWWISENGFTKEQIHKATNYTPHTKEENLKTTNFPYIKGTFFIGKILNEYNLNATFNTNPKPRNIIRTPKQQHILKVYAGIYEILCTDSNRLYVDNTNSRIRGS